MIDLSPRIERKLSSVGKVFGSSEREEDDQHDGQDRQAVDREQPADALAERQALELDRGRFEGGRSNGLHRRPVPAPVPAATPPSEVARVMAADRERRGRQLGDDLAAAEDQRPVADRRDLLEVGRDQDDRLPARRGPRRAGGRSRPWRRRRRRRSGPRAPAPRPPIRSQRAMTTFCWLPPERVSIGSLGIVGRQADLARRARGSPRASRRRAPAEAGRGPRRRD